MTAEIAHVRATDARPLREWLLLVPALVFSAVVYFPITRNYFYSDDFLNLYYIVNNHLPEYLFTPNGGHILLTRNAVFYLTASLFGAQPEPFYWSAFLTHLINVALLFGVVRRLTGSARLACFGSALWGVSPLHQGTLGWYAVYGHVLVATVLLVILYQAAGEAMASPLRPAPRWLWYALALMAATSFGTGIGIAMVLPFALALLLRPVGASLRRPPLMSLLVVVPVLYVLVLWVYGLLSGTSAAKHSPPLVLLSRPIAILSELPHLLGLGLTRLIFGVYLPPWLTAGVWYALLAAFASAVVAVMMRASDVVRARIAACILLLLGCYGMVAVGRGLFLSEVPAQVFLALSRYHYVGQLVLTLTLCLVLSQLASPFPAWLRSLALLAWFGLAVAVHVRFGTAIDNHFPARRDAAYVLTTVRAAAEEQPDGADVYFTNRMFGALPLPLSIFPGWAGVFAIFQPDNTVAGRRVYFIESDPDALAAARRGIRTDTLLVPPRADDRN